MNGLFDLQKGSPNEFGLPLPVVGLIFDDPVLHGPNVARVDERRHVENVLARTHFSRAHGFHRNYCYGTFEDEAGCATTSAGTVPDGTKGSAKN